MSKNNNEKYSLNGKTAIITGADDNAIGNDTAFTLAKEGCNLALIGEDKNELDNLAEKCEKEDIKVAVFVCNLTDASQIAKTISSIMSHFGQIDYIANISSFVALTNTSQSDVSDIDKMLDINGRAGYLLVKEASSFLSLSDNSHIVNISPPISVDANYFQNHIPYTLSKYMSSLCTLGLSYELYHSNIAVNSVWPRVVIDTPNIRSITGDNIPKSFLRKPQIIADCCKAIFQKPSQICSGTFMIDDLCLIGEGVENFDIYANEAGSPLIENLFVPKDTPPPPKGVIVKKMNLLKQITKH